MVEKTILSFLALSIMRAIMALQISWGCKAQGKKPPRELQSWKNICKKNRE